MAESIYVDPGAPKPLRYEQLLPQVKTLIGDERQATAVLSTVAAALHEAFGFLWTGFYLVDGVANELVVGPFQGPVACLRIAYGKGVCGAAWTQNETIVVYDVDQFPGHIACSSLSKSEIVVPLRDASGTVRAVLDIDSRSIGTFDQWDRTYLEQLCDWIGTHIFK